jgi:hypothetical protein
VPGPACSYLYDIVRASVVAPSEEAILGVLEKLRAHPKARVVRLKNRFKSPTPGENIDQIVGWGLGAYYGSTVEPISQHSGFD